MNYMLLGDRYELLEKVGEGGMAIVYKARDRKLNRFVAVKVLKDSFKENEEIIRKFKKEAQAIATLSDPNIVNVLDVGNQDEINYIVMEFIEGKTLKKIIQEKGSLPNEVAIRIAIKVASALGCAHKNNIVHRDIKPHNILVTGEGVVKVTDFGIAKSMDSSTLAHTNTIMGSAHYFSPEQAKGSYIDFRTDIYSLGVVIYEMITGRVPFDGDTAVTVALKHIQDKVTSPKEINPNVSESLNNLVLKCMAKDPKQRYQSVVEVKVDLERIKDNPNMVVNEASQEDDSDYTRVMSPVSMDDTIYQSTPLYTEHDNKDVYEDHHYEEDEDEYEEYENDFDEDKGRKKGGKGVGTGIIIAIVAIIVICGGIFAGVKLGGKRSSSTVIKVPSLINMTVQDAENQLTSLGLKFTVTEQEDNAAEGTVIKTNPVAGTQVNKNDTITLVVSAGDKNITIQDVSTMNPEVAKQALQAENLVPNITYDYSSTIPKGQVIGTNPSAGTKVAKGSTVNIIVSKGPQETMVEVPNLTGMTVEQATQVLKSLGLKINKNQGKTASSAADNGKIYEQSPSGGYSVKAGATINVSYYGNYVEQVTPTPPTPTPTPPDNGNGNQQKPDGGNQSGQNQNDSDKNNDKNNNVNNNTNNNGNQGDNTNKDKNKENSASNNSSGNGANSGQSTIVVKKTVTTTN